MKKESLKILEDAISDVGYWRWWIEEKYFYQIEFGGTQLFNPPEKEGIPPSGVIALRFIDVSVICAIEKEKIDKGWYLKLQKDEIEPFTISHGQFTLTDPGFASNIFKSAARKEFKKGNEQKLYDSLSQSSFIAFWAGSVGLIVLGKSLRLFTHSGELKENEIEKKFDEWWTYWKEYWKRKNTNNPMPEDYACEATIPAGK